MLIHPWDAAVDQLEWQTWLAGTERRLTEIGDWRTRQR